MAQEINNIEERIERSLFERLRKNLVLYSYLPDIADTARYPVTGGNLTDVANDNWIIDKKALKTTRGFCIEIFGTSTAFSKGAKEGPRMVIISKRIIDGDLGLPPGVTYNPDPDVPGDYLAYPNPAAAVNMHFDIHLLSTSAAQRRTMNWILQLTLGLMKYIPFYDVDGERFFIKQYNYYDISDTNDSIEEDVYSYEVQDLFLFDINTATVDGPGTGVVKVSAIKEIDTDFVLGYYILNSGLSNESLNPENPTDNPVTLKVGQMPP